MKQKVLFLFILVGLLPIIAKAQVEKSSNTGAFSFHLDNDGLFFSGTDQYYTNGIKVTWISPDINNYQKHNLLKWLPFVNKSGFKHAISISVGHNIYTPEDITRIDLIKEDHPYAGILYFEIGIHSRSSRRMDTLEIDLGIVGPSSFAGEVQKVVHKLLNFTYPNGWQHQLKDEPVFEIIYERKWKVLKSTINGGFGLDLIPHLGVGLGNVYTYGNTGMQFRFGWNLPDDFGTSLIRPSGDTNGSIYKHTPNSSVHGRFGIHVFVAVDGQAVLRNIFLDGNTFKDSHRVDKKTFIADIIAGISLRIGRFKLSYSCTFLTKQFRTQKNNHVFGSINLSYSY